MRRALLILASVGFAAACDNSGGSSTAPTAALPTTTETFTGTVQPMGSDAHKFTVAQAGEVDVTLTTAGPPATIFMGLGIGNPGTTEGSCTPIAGASVSVQAGSNPQLVGSAAAGAFCVMVFDIGNQTAPVDYTVNVAHP